MTGEGKLRIMLVDDHALVRSAVRQALSAPDVEVVGEAGSAEEALEQAPTLQPDVLLLDIDLPGMDGVRLLRELAPRLPDTQIVMLTVSSSRRLLIDAMRSGAAGYLTKDLSPDALLRAVRGIPRGDLPMVQALLPLLGDSHPRVRKRAAEAVARASAPECADYLYKVGLRHPQKFVRIHSIEALAASNCGEPLYLVLEDDRGIAGVFPGLVRKVGRWRLFGSPLAGWQTDAACQDAEGLTVSASRPVDELRLHASLLSGATDLVAYTLRRSA